LTVIPVTNVVGQLTVTVTTTVTVR
jgi:hypothetical protein